jgi:hypothetical protein
MFGGSTQNIQRFRWLRYLRPLLVNYPGYQTFQFFRANSYIFPVGRSLEFIKFAAADYRKVGPSERDMLN